MRLFLSITVLISSVSFAQIAPGTETCFGAAVQTASNKIAKDSKTAGSVLNEIGFVAASCQYNRASEMIECSDREGVVQFDVAFGSSKVLKLQADYARFAYEFVTGTQGVDVHYELFFKQAAGTTTCNYETTEVWTDGYEEAGGKTAAEIKLCIDECFAVFDRPGAELKACVSKCKE